LGEVAWAKSLGRSISAEVYSQVACRSNLALGELALGELALGALALGELPVAVSLTPAMIDRHSPFA
jgi:hypothetical protein